jgi:hypothetical protein
MKISVKLEASQYTSHTTIDLQDLNLTKEEWDNLPYDEKMELKKEAIYDLPEQPYWCLDSFSEKE